MNTIHCVNISWNKKILKKNSKTPIVNHLHSLVFKHMPQRDFITFINTLVPMLKKKSICEERENCLSYITIKDCYPCISDRCCHLRIFGNSNAVNVFPFFKTCLNKRPEECLSCLNTLISPAIWL